MFWCVSYYLGAFGTVWLPYETRAQRAELVQKFVPRSRVGIFGNDALDLAHWTLNWRFRVFRTI